MHFGLYKTNARYLIVYLILYIINNSYCRFLSGNALLGILFFFFFFLIMTTQKIPATRNADVPNLCFDTIPTQKRKKKIYNNVFLLFV